MKKLISFILLILTPVFLFSQTGTPFIKNFSPEEYSAEGQIWAAVQDDNGMMYFGSNSGVLIYDGHNWETIKLPNNSPVRSLCKNSDGIIFAAAVGEFGYISQNENKGFKYVSLSENLNDSMCSFSDVWTMKAAGNTVWFATNEFLFRYNANKKPSVIIVNKKQPPFLLYKAGKNIFVSIRAKGTYKITNDSLIPLKRMEKRHPWFMIPYINDRIIIGDLDGLSIYNPNEPDSDKFVSSDIYFDKKNIKKTNEFLNQYQLYTGAVEIGNGKYAVGTLRNGIVIIDRSGKIINIINEGKGLQSNTIHSLYKDMQNELWACTAYGISKIDINTPYELFSKKQGIKGSIYDVLRFQNQFYVSSNLGLFYYTKTGFKGVENLSGKNALQILSPYIYNTEKDSFLFVNTIYGMYRIDNNHPIKINSISYNSIIQSDFIKSTVYLTVNYELFRMTFQNNTFSSPEKIEKFEDLVFLGYELDKNNLFLILNERAVLYNLTTHTSSDIKIDAKINDIDKIDGKIIAYTDKGLFTYNPEKTQFIKDELYTAELEKNTEILQFEKSSENYFWLLAKETENNNPFVAKINKKNGIFHIQKKPYKRFSGINAVYQDGDSLLWAINSKILYKYTIRNNKNFKKKANCLLRKISLINDSVIFSGVISSGKPVEEPSQNVKINYDYNDISFEFSLTSYEGNKNEYSYKLERDNEKSWSLWTETNFKEYTNLYEGEYTFSVKGRNVYGAESEPVKFTFEILPPWYRTWYLYLTYLIFLTFLIWGFVKLNAKRLEQDNIRLDNIVKERTAEILTQKEEIQTQADYLEDVNNELNQKNEEISTIAENLKEANLKINIKNKYIIDSINYAQKIQKAALPSDTEISKLISDFFIIYKPKDIVSGDFYFIKKRGDYLILAVADCTGHGVPGGFLAMMSMAVLSDVVQDTEITNPAAALEKMRTVIKKALHQNTYLESQNEGIEIALCAIDTKDLSLEYAGANHPLFITRQEGEKFEIIEIEADPQPVGIHYKEKPFELKQFQLKENDMIYMFSDGYFDQFGGPNKKKFLLNNLKDLLKEISSESIKIQKRKILNAFNSWKGENKQVDDVLLLGIRVKNF